MQENVFYIMGKYRHVLNSNIMRLLISESISFSHLNYSLCLGSSLTHLSH